MKKTAMQNHLNWIKHHFKDVGHLDYECVVAQLQMGIEETERDQIEKAFTDGAVESSKSCLDKKRLNESPDEYYDRLYK